MLTQKKKNIDQAMSFKYWPARNDIKKKYVPGKSHISKSIMIHRYTDSDKNKPLQLKNQSKLPRRRHN